MVAMEPPTGFDAAAIHKKKVELNCPAMPALKPSQAVRGQYGAGTELGNKVKSYRQEPNVDLKSERRGTYVALQPEIDDPGGGPACRSMSAPANAWRGV